jgi:hypothetical protein
MEWTFKFIDIHKTLADPTQLPEDFINRKDAEYWMYLDGPLIMDAHGVDQPWRKVISGDAVRIPLIPYCTANKDPTVALAHAFQLGARAFLDWGSDYVNRVHTSVGTPVEEIDNYAPVKPKGVKVDCFRFWIGLAIRLRK